MTEETDIQASVPIAEGCKADGGRAGDLIHQEVGVEVRTVVRDDEAHSVWIGKDVYVLGRGILEEYGLRTSPSKMEEQLNSYNSRILESLKKINLSPEGLGLVLAHALIYEHVGHEERLTGDVQRARRQLKRRTIGE